MMTKDCFKNRLKIEQAQQASCFYCFTHYDADGIKDLDWTDAGQTAICPSCGVDALLAGAPTQDEMQALNKAHFY